MKYIADFHIHSHFSVATSGTLVPEHLEYWARLKGIDVVGTGDCVHPGWLDELKEKLEPAENGLFCLKEQYRLDESRHLSGKNMPRPRSTSCLPARSAISTKRTAGCARCITCACSPISTPPRRCRRGSTGWATSGRTAGRSSALTRRYSSKWCLNHRSGRSLFPCHIWTPVVLRARVEVGLRQHRRML